MRLPSLRLYLAVALPALLLAVVGTTHPMLLNDRTAVYWRNLHIALLPVFPLLGLAPWLIARRYGPLFGWMTGVLGFVYAMFYGALDVLSGIGAGGLQLAGFGASTSVVFVLGRELGLVGSVAFGVSTLIAAGLVLRQARLAAVPGAVLVIGGAALLYRGHIYWPVGVVAMLALAAGWLALLWAQQRAASTRHSAR